MAKPALATSLLVVFGLAGIPLTAFAAAEPPAKSGDYYTKKICETIRPVGSRLGGTRRCRSQAEIDAEQEENRKVVTRIQTQRPTMCPPPPLPC